MRLVAAGFFDELSSNARSFTEIPRTASPVAILNAAVLLYLTPFTSRVAGRPGLEYVA